MVIELLVRFCFCNESLLLPNAFGTFMSRIELVARFLPTCSGDTAENCVGDFGDLGEFLWDRDIAAVNILEDID